MNTARLKSVLRRAAADEELTIGFLGGSSHRAALPPSRKTPTPTAYTAGGVRPSRRQNFTMSTAVSAVPTRCMGCPAL